MGSIPDDNSSPDYPMIGGTSPNQTGRRGGSRDTKIKNLEIEPKSSIG